MRNLIIWFVTFTLCCPYAWARSQSPVIRAADAPIVNFKAWLATQSRYQAYSEWWIRNRVSHQDEVDIERALELAQAEFLQGGLEQAKRLFAALVDHKHTRDWRAAHRKAFAYAHLRLAQLSDSVEDRTSHILFAGAFGPVELAADLFPRPVWLEYKKALSEQFEEQMDLDLWFAGVRYLLIDGRPFDAIPSARLPIDPHKHRFTLVFDHASPVSLVSTWSEFKKWRPAAPAYASGSCESIQFSREILGRGDVLTYVDDNCLKTPNPEIKPGVPAKNEVQPLGGNWSDTPEFKKTSRLNPWILAGIGIVAAGAILMLNQHANEKAEPSTTVGF